jgi:glycosyltransferase involved in cell wall biosynthesis
VITDGVNGLLVSPSDEAALAGVLSKLTNDRSLIARLAQAARNTRHTSVRDHAHQVEAIYSEVIRPFGQ